MNTQVSSSGADIWKFLAPSLQKYADNVAWKQRLSKGEERSVTYAEILVAVERLAGVLRSRGVGIGDVVGVMAPNGPEWSVAALAVWRLGAIVAPVHVGNSDDDIDTQLEAVKPKVLCLHGADDRFNNTQMIDLTAPAGTGEAAPVVDNVDIEYESEAVRIYTSGSTGTPKMVRLSHENLVSNTEASCRVIELGPEDVFLQLLPMSHTMGLTGGLMLACVNGAKLVVPRVIAANEIIAALSEENVSLMVAVPRLFRNIMHGLEKRFSESSAPLRAYIWVLRHIPLSLRDKINGPLKKKFGRVRCWVSGGSRLDPEITRYFRQIGFPVRQGYGLTETSPTVSIQEHNDAEFDGVGRPLDGVEVRIADPDANGSGELLVRGSSVMMGYTDDSLTQEVMEDGWFKTGDIARVTGDGKIVLTGRAKRLIVTEAGKNVYPEEIEILLERYTEIKEAGVIEMDMKPVVVVASDEEGDEAVQTVRGVLKDFNARTSGHNQISRFAIVDELPRTPLGKIALANLPDVFAENEIRK